MQEKIMSINRKDFYEVEGMESVENESTLGEDTMKNDGKRGTRRKSKAKEKKKEADLAKVFADSMNRRKEDDEQQFSYRKKQEGRKAGEHKNRSSIAEETIKRAQKKKTYTA